MEFKQDFYGLGCFLLINVGMFIWWIGMKLGMDKRWFVVSAWPLISRSFYFFLPSFALGFAIGLVGAFLVVLNPDNSSALLYLFTAFGLWALGFVFAFLEPSWMSPAWYRWLKREYGDIMPYLVMDAHNLGRQEWMRRVETQTGLEQWAAEVRQKYTL